jgi:hypothetical protein
MLCVYCWFPWIKHACMNPAGGRPVLPAAENKAHSGKLLLSCWGALFPALLFCLQRREALLAPRAASAPPRESSPAPPRRRSCNPRRRSSVAPNARRALAAIPAHPLAAPRSCRLRRPPSPPSPRVSGCSCPRAGRSWSLWAPGLGPQSPRPPQPAGAFTPKPRAAPVRAPRSACHTRPPLRRPCSAARLDLPGTALVARPRHTGLTWVQRRHTL